MQGRMKVRPWSCTEKMKGNQSLRAEAPSTKKPRLAPTTAAVEEVEEVDVERPRRPPNQGGAAPEQQISQSKDKAVLPDELWAKILEGVDDNSVTAFASVCTQLRRVQKGSKRKLRTDLRLYSPRKRDVINPQQKELIAVSEAWCLWSLVFLTLKREKVKRSCIINAASFWGYLNALKIWKKQSRSKTLFNEQTCIFTGLGGHLNVLVWLRDGGCPWDKRTCEAAASGGHLDMLKYLHERGCPWDEEICSTAAFNGHLLVLKYLREKECEWNEDTCSSAASRGHLEVLKYARENGCPWDEGTCYAAAFNGHLRVLKYAREQGCPWDVECIAGLQRMKEITWKVSSTA